MPKRILMGFDPGLASCGYGVIEIEGSRARHLAHGVLETRAGSLEEDRLMELFEGIRVLLETWAPEAAGVETIFFAKNSSSAIPVAQARGVILLACAQARVRVHHLSPPRIKQWVTGNGRADKRQVQTMIQFLLGLSSMPESDHAADALAAAYCVWQEDSNSEIINL